ncbi:MAG TPA: serine/threonine-protein kinase [Longimicrobium sp.]|nr:serine/threonine-protein kinase [Longimicrobium sp.]
MYGIAGLLTGRTLCGRYRIDAVVGRGGMGAVYRGTDERLGRAVAVKVIGIVAHDPQEHARLRGRFHREARAAAALHHPNIVSVHDYGSDEELGLDFLVMELLEGEDLSRRLARGEYPSVAHALSILRQAGRGLAAGHRAGLVHRDVKPGNLFLEAAEVDGEPRVRVLDFGIAQMEADEGTVTQLTEYGRSPFSPAYASPEQLRGDDRATPASDVFSLAAVGYHLLTGLRPFTSSDHERMGRELADALRALPERMAHVPPAARAALARALSHVPAERFRDAGEFADALTREGAAPPPLPVAEAAPRPAARPLAAAVSVEPSAPDHTQLLTPPPVPAAAAAPSPVRPQVAMPAPAPQPAFSLPSAPALPVQRAPEPVAAPRPGLARRFFAWLWDFTVTLVVLGLFTGAWVLAASGVVDDDVQRVYAGAAASILFTPLAIHRLTGRRGRYGVGLLGSAAATGGAVYYIGTSTDPALLLAAVFGLQVVTSFLLARLTRRRPQPPQVPAYY